jgi:hypothetical protein
VRRQAARALEDGTIGRGPADDRRTGAIAAEVARTTPEQDQGDGGTPPDPDENLRRFVVADAGGRERDGGWLSGLREYVPTPARCPAAASSKRASPFPELDGDYSRRRAADGMRHPPLHCCDTRLTARFGQMAGG